MRSLQDHIWVIDPSGNLMLRWPKNAESNGVKRDIAQLLKVAAGWVRIDASTRIELKGAGAMTAGSMLWLALLGIAVAAVPLVYVWRSRDP